MARKTKFPVTHIDKEIPYDKEGFINWCVMQQGLEECSARQYANEVKMAYLTVFEETGTLFEDIEDAFTVAAPGNIPDVWKEIWTEWNSLYDKWPDMEDAYDDLMDYIYELDHLNEYGDISLETTDGKKERLPVSNWTRSFQTYARYIRWRIDEVYAHNCIPPKLIDRPWDPSEFYNLPLHRQFKVYLKRLHRKQPENWTSKNPRRKNSYKGEGASYTWSSRLTKIYNRLLLTTLDRKVVATIDERLRMGQKLWLPKFRKWLTDFIDRESRDFSAEVLSKEDIRGGKNALRIYFDFMKAYSKAPEDYQPESHTRKKK